MIPKLPEYQEDPILAAFEFYVIQRGRGRMQEGVQRIEREYGVPDLHAFVQMLGRRDTEILEPVHEQAVHRVQQELQTQGMGEEEALETARRGVSAFATHEAIYLRTPTLTHTVMRDPDEALSESGFRCLLIDLTNKKAVRWYRGKPCPVDSAIQHQYLPHREARRRIEADWRIVRAAIDGMLEGLRQVLDQKLALIADEFAEEIEAHRWLQVPQNMEALR